MRRVFLQLRGQNAGHEIRSGQWTDLARQSGVSWHGGGARRLLAQRLGYTRLQTQGGRVNKLWFINITINNSRSVNHYHVYFKHFHFEHHIHAFN